MDFSEEQIQKIFGHEAAEDESIERLEQYFFKSDVFEQITANLPLRILVAHKGVGKSALLRIAFKEDNEADRLAIWIKPDDILPLGNQTDDFLGLIRTWKDGLYKIITRKVMQNLGCDDGDLSARALAYGGKIIDFFSDFFRNQIETVSLEDTKKLIISNFLHSKKVIIYIDDLDRGWEASKTDIKKLSTLLNAVRDIVQENSGLSFRISLRTDVYYLVRTSDESTDKIENSIVWQQWTNHEIFVLLIKRLTTFEGKSISEEELSQKNQRQLAEYLRPYMAAVFEGKGKWERVPIYRVLMTLIRQRPRDLVKLCSMAARKARQNRNSIIQTTDFQSIFGDYSQNRLQDTVNEFRSELPEIERLLLAMKPATAEKAREKGFIYTSDELLAKLGKIKNNAQLTFRNGKTSTPADLANFLYKINFLTARKVLETNEIQRHYFETNKYLSQNFSSFGYDWEIHPAYRWVLQPTTPETIYAMCDLSV